MRFKRTKEGKDGYDLIEALFKRWYENEYPKWEVIDTNVYMVKFRNWYDGDVIPDWDYCYIECDFDGNITFEYDFDEGEDNYEIAGFARMTDVCRGWEDWKL